MSDNQELLSSNAKVITQELAWLRQVATARNLNDKEPVQTLKGHTLPTINQDTPYGALAVHLTIEDRLLLILSLCPHVAHTLLEDMLLSVSTGLSGRPQNQVAASGLVMGAQFQGYLPTALTFLHLAAGMAVNYRIRLMKWLGEKQSKVLAEEKVLLAPPKPLEPVFSSVLYMPPKVISELLMIDTDALPGQVKGSF